MDVTLTWAETLAAVSIGGYRRIASLQAGLISYSEGLSWTEDIEGAGAELAVAKYLDRFWTASVNSFDRDVGDVGRLQVRRVRKATHRLIVRQRDLDDHKFILVAGELPKFDVAGWIYGHEAKQTEYLDDPNDRESAYFVPRSALRPTKELRLFWN